MIWSGRKLVELLFNLAILGAVSLSVSGAAEPLDDPADGTGMNEVWSGRIAPFDKPPTRIILEGVDQAGLFRPLRAVIPEASDTPPSHIPLPLERNLLRNVEARAFGIEERVSGSVGATSSLVIECKSGSSPAGLLAGVGNAHLPREVPMRLIVRSKGDAGFTIAVVDRATGEKVLASAELAADEIVLELPTQSWEQVELPDIRILCPETSSRIEIQSARLQVIDGGTVPTGAGTWMWSFADALAANGQLEERLEGDGIDQVYLQLPVAGGSVEHETDIRAFVERLNGRNIDVLAVEGDPEMASGDGRLNALARARAISKFITDAAKKQQLAGVQYDIEPYLRDPDASHEEMWDEWTATIVALAEEIEGPVSVVVPFWMQASAGGIRALDNLGDEISEIVVMAYRTDEASLWTICEPWLAYGASRGKSVRIALENGILEKELHRVYRRAEKGPLALKIDVDGAPTVSFGKTSLTTSGEHWWYDLSHEVVIDPRRISFMGETATMLMIADRVAPKFAAWRSFAGFAFHGLGIEARAAASANETKK